MTTTNPSALGSPIRTVVRRVERQRGPVTPDLVRDVRRVHTLAGWLDTRFSLFGVRFGLDTLVGLIPVVGDTATSLVGLYPLWVARRHKLGKRVQARMGLNLGLDWLIGLIPLVGDLFDIGYKGNARNAKILAKAAAKAGVVNR
jgi:hypothetical protein